MARFIAIETYKVLMASFNAGASIRAAAIAAGVSKTTASRYVPRNVIRLCPCGSPAGHRGWCRHLYLLSPARQAFHASRRLTRSRASKTRRTPDLHYPFVYEMRSAPGYDLMFRVNAAVPRYYDPDLRADICQEVIAGILAGEFSETNLGDAMKQSRKRIFDQMNALSLDYPIPGTGVRLNEALTDQDSIWAFVA